MNYFKKLIALTLFLYSTLIQAQSPQTGTLKGIIKDSTQTLMGAVVYCESNRTYASVSDDQGNFLIRNIAPGNYTFVANYTGYKTKLFTNVTIEAGKTITLEITLIPTSEKTNETRNTSKRSQGITRGSSTANSMYYFSQGLTGSVERGASEEEPIEFNTESYNSIQENDYKDTKENPLSTFSIDVDNASYTNSRRYIDNGNLPPRDAVRVEEFINYFNYAYPQPTDQHPFSIYMEQSICPWNEKHQLIHVGIQGKNVPFEKINPMNLVFLVDVSGSMSSENKLPLVQKSLILLTDKMRPQDRIAIVVYAGAAGLALPSTPASDKATIYQAITNLKSGGSTAGGEGIKLAYKIAQENIKPGTINRVILASDGDFNVGVSSDGEMTRLIEEKRETGIYLTVLGFGMGNYKDSKMEAIADHGNGNYFYIDNINESKKIFIDEIDGTLYTIAKDVKIQVEFNPAKIKSYRLVGYENRILNKEDFNNDKKDAGELGAGHTVTALYEVIPADSKEIATSSVDKLKYQKETQTTSASNSNEVLTIKFRYKIPGESESKLITKTLTQKLVELNNTSNSFRFSAAVAEFGLLLRDSKFKENASFEKVISLASAALGEDKEGYRSDFVRLAKTALLLYNTELKTKSIDK